MNHQTPCTQWAELLAVSHPEDELSPSEYAALETHVAQCQHCTSVRQQYNLLAAHARAIPFARPLSSDITQLIQLHEDLFTTEKTEMVVIISRAATTRKHTRWDQSRETVDRRQPILTIIVVVLLVLALFTQGIVTLAKFIHMVATFLTDLSFASLIIAAAALGGNTIISFALDRRGHKQHRSLKFMLLVATVVLLFTINFNTLINLLPMASGTFTGGIPKEKLVPTPGPKPPVDLFFGFEGSTDGWGTSEGGYKLAKVSEATSPVYSGIGSLRVTSTLIGSGSSHYHGNSEYTHTEATDYFSAQSLNGRTVSCYVFLPPELAPKGTSPGYIRVFVKDTQFRNDFSHAITIGPSTVGKWVKLTFVIGANKNNEDQGFDATQVSAVGIRIDLFNGATLDYTGPFYIDSVSL